jgi:RyR domain
VPLETTLAALRQAEPAQLPAFVLLRPTTAQDSSREAVEFALHDPTPGAQHEAWVSCKERDGWVYGPNKDEKAKTHPSLRPFDELPETERTKDALLIGIVKDLAPLFGVAACA